MKHISEVMPEAFEELITIKDNYTRLKMFLSLLDVQALRWLYKFCQSGELLKLIIQIGKEKASCTTNN